MHRKLKNKGFSRETVAQPFKKILGSEEGENIRSYHEYGGDRKIHPKNHIGHHEACPVTIDGIAVLRDRFFYLSLTQMMDSFSCSHLI